MKKPEIATILEDGSYGQREMTDEEIAEYKASIADSPTLSVTGDE
jgi:hypothetical protein